VDFEKKIENTELDGEVKVELVRYYEELKGHDYSDRTIRSYLNTLIKFLKKVKKPVKTIDGADISHYLSKTKVSGRSKAHCKSVLMGFFNEFLDMGINLKRRMMRGEGFSDYHVEPLKIYQVVSLMENAPSLRGLVAIKLGYDGMLRVSEVVSLKLSDIDFESKTIYARRSKWGSEGRVKLSEDTLETLGEFIEGKFGDSWNGTEYLFAHGEGHYCTKTIQEDFKKAKKGANLGREGVDLTKCGFHILRHSMATYLFWSGVNLTVVSKQLRHKNPTTTLDSYMHLIDNKKEILSGWWKDRYARMYL